MKEKNALDKIREGVLEEIKKGLEKTSKDLSPQEAHQKLVAGIKQEINKSFEKFDSLQKAENSLNKTTHGLASSTPSEMEVKQQNSIPIKSVFEILSSQVAKAEELEKGMGFSHYMRAGTRGTAGKSAQQADIGNQQRMAARNAATAIQSPAPKTKSIPSKLKMSHGDYGITKNADGTLSLIYNKKYKSPILSFLFGNKPKELGRFGHRAEAYQALLGHHDQVNAGLIKGEEMVDKNAEHDLQPKIKGAVIPGDKKVVSQDSKDTGSGGQIKKTKPLSKGDETGVVPAPKAPEVTGTKLSAQKPSLAAAPKGLPKITPQPAKPVDASRMGSNTLISNAAQFRPNNALEDRMNIMSGIKQFSKDEELGKEELCKECGLTHDLKKGCLGKTQGPIDGGGAVTGDNQLDKKAESPEKQLQDLDKSFWGGKDKNSKAMRSQAVADSYGEAKRKAALPTRQQAPAPKLPSPEQHAARAAEFSDFMPKGKFNKAELLKQMEVMNKWEPSLHKEESTDPEPAPKGAGHVKHSSNCKMAFGKPKPETGCERCKQLAEGAPARKGYGMSRKQMDRQRSEEIKRHNCKNSGCGPVCTFGDW